MLQNVLVREVTAIASANLLVVSMMRYYLCLLQHTDVANQKSQTMAGSATDIQQLEHRLGTTVIVATHELEHNHVLAN